MAKIVPFPAVNAVIFNEKNEILLTRRSSQIREPGKWCLPGGHVEGGEDFLTALHRETKEEVGLTILEQDLLGVYSDPSLTVTENTLGNGHKGHFLVVAFVVTKFEGEIQPNEEVDRWVWCSQDSLPEPIIRSHPIRIEDAYRFQGKAFVR